MLPSASWTSMSTPSPDALALVTLALVWLVIPCFRNDFSSSADTASSSTGTSRGSSSTMVTSLPNRRKIDANSTPTAPLPRISDRLRHLGEVNRLVARDDALAIDLDARDAARRRAGRDNHVPAGMKHLRVALEHLHARRAAGLTHEPRCPFDPFDLVLLEQELDALASDR